MKRLLSVAAAALAGACATQQEICISRANAELSKLEDRAAEIQTNIDRGYAVHSSREPYTVLTECTRPDGTTYACEETRYQTKETPVSLDIAAEKQKLGNLRRRMAVARTSIVRAIQQCRLAYPE